MTTRSGTHRSPSAGSNRLDSGADAAGRKPSTKLIKRLAQVLGIATISVVVLSVAATVVSPSIAWRVRLLKQKMFGRIPEIPLPLLLKWIRPGSPVNLHHLADVPNVNASITNIVLDGSTEERKEAADAGSRIYGRVCSQCHGDDARGRNGPNLLAAIGTMTDWQFFSTVKWGRRNTIMRAQPLPDLEIWQVSSFLRQSAIDGAIGKKGVVAALLPLQPVTPAMLLSAGQTGDWITYAGNYAGYRHANEDQITPQNIQRVRLAWAAQLPSDGDFQESSPIVVAGRMFVTEPPEGVTALNAKTGAVLWQFHRPLPSNMPSPCCGFPNRGVAVYGTRVYVETFDAHLVALDADTGVKIWDVRVADYHHGYSMTAAPLVVKDSIVVGMAGADLGMRGFLAAYAASDGAPLWRFYTVPGPGEPGHETWQGNSWEHGGGSTWVTGAYDPALGLIYWGTGNPAPVFYTKKRAGDNLYTCSVIALDATTGQLRWYYQFTPSDDHGWDSSEQPVLANIQWHGENTPSLFLANRNAFFYGLDRRTGRFLFARPFAKQTWASGFNQEGRPILLPNSHPTPTGSVISPASNGATNWWPPSFDPSRNLLYVPSADTADMYFNVDTEEYKDGRTYLGSGFERAHNQPTTLALRAIDVSTGQLRWDATLEKGGGEVAGEMGGVLSTVGGLVFVGHGNEFDAFDSTTGVKLWATNLGEAVHAAPISYAIADQQYVAVFSGRTLFVFALPTTDHGKEARAARSAF